MDWNKHKMPITLTAAVLASAVAWGQLDLPRPAMKSEVDAVMVLVAENSQLILGDRWIRLTAQIELLKAELKRDPTNKKKIDELAVKQGQLREVNGKLNK